MAIKLYDLAGAEDDRRFSPNCWRSRMALKHKGLEFETIPWRFTEKDAIAFSGQGLVPVLVDGSNIIHDSGASRSTSRRPIRSARDFSRARSRARSRSSSSSG